jgi:hypothetical protein
MAEIVESAGAGNESESRRKRQMEVPPDLDSRFLRVGNKLYRSAHDREPVATITPDRIKAKDRDSLPDLIRLAKENGWTSIKVSGDAEFQRAAYLAASAQGIKVDGYRPGAINAHGKPGSRYQGTAGASHRPGRAFSPAVGRAERQRPGAAQGAKPCRPSDGGRG